MIATAASIRQSSGTSMVLALLLPNLSHRLCAFRREWVNRSAERQERSSFFDLIGEGDEASATGNMFQLARQNPSKA
jgi:hypothetical protein